VEQYRKTTRGLYSEADERTLGFREILFGCVLRKPLLWANRRWPNAFVLSCVRRGERIPTYLRREPRKGFSIQGVENRLVAVTSGRRFPEPSHCGMEYRTSGFQGQGCAGDQLSWRTLAAVVVYWLTARVRLWIDYADHGIGFLIEARS